MHSGRIRGLVLVTALLFAVPIDADNIPKQLMRSAPEDAQDELRPSYLPPPELPLGGPGTARLSGTEPLEPVGNWYWGYVNKLALVDEYVYLAMPYGVMIADVSDPSTPDSVSGYYLRSGARDIAVSGTFAYVACDFAGLTVLDISDRSQPTLAGSYTLPGYTYAVSVSGTLLGVLNDSLGLLVMDISNPRQVKPAGSLDFPGVSVDVLMDGNLVYLAQDLTGLFILDLTDRQNPEVVKVLAPQSRLLRLVQHGHHLYLVESFVREGYEPAVWPVEIVDVSDPAAAYVVGTYIANTTGHGVAVTGDRAYVTLEFGGFDVVDVSDPALPTRIGRDSSLYRPTDAYVRDSFLLIADRYYGFRVFDVRDPDTALPAARFPLAGRPNSLAARDGLLYISDDNGLFVADLSEPTRPRLVGRAETPAGTRDIQISDGYLYAMDNPTGLLIFDLDDPTDPEWIGKYDAISRPGLFGSGGLMVAGDYASFWSYGDFYLRLSVLGISNYAAPSRIGQLDAMGIPSAALGATHLYLIHRDEGLMVLDIGAPHWPTYTAQIGELNRGGELTLAGDRLYIIEPDSSLVTVAVSDAANPRMLGRYKLGTRVSRLYPLGDRILVSSLFRRFELFDPRDPAYWIHLASFETPCCADGLAVWNDYLYLCQGDGMLIYKLPAAFVRGDVNADGAITLVDVVYLANYLFAGGPAPQPMPDAGDTDCDGHVSIADVVILVNYLHRGGLAPGCPGACAP